MIKKKTILEPEKVAVDTWYTLSINLDPKLKHNHIIDGKHVINKGMFDRLQTEKAIIYDIINTINSPKYALFPELSRTGRLHWHGVIRFNTELEIGIFYFRALPLLLKVANIEIDEVNDLELWKDYMMKGEGYMKALLEHLKLTEIYPFTNMNITISRPHIDKTAHKVAHPKD